MSEATVQNDTATEQTPAVISDKNWRAQIGAMEPQLARALPSHIPAERFVRATETAIMRDSQLLGCNRKSLFQAVMQCAETGLMPNGRDAALVRFKGNVQFIPMIGGILRLMRNTGEVQTLIAEVVCEKDEFFYRLGDDPKIEHTPAMGDRGAVKCAYAILKTKDGGVYREVMSRADIDKVQRCSQAKNGPWKSWYEEMARKTVLRRLAKKCPLSTDTLIDLASRDDEMYDLSAIAGDESDSQIDAMRARLRGEPAVEDLSQDNDGDRPEDESQAPRDEPNEDEAAPRDDTIDVEPEDDSEADPSVKQHAAGLYGSQSEALADIERQVGDLATIKDVDDAMAGWRPLVRDSFEQKTADDVLKLGNAIALKRKQVVS